MDDATIEKQYSVFRFGIFHSKNPTGTSGEITTAVLVVAAALPITVTAKAATQITTITGEEKDLSTDQIRVQNIRKGNSLSSQILPAAV